MESFTLLVVMGLICHVHGADIREEIWNGYNAVKGQFPYQALLICQSADGNTFCGGSLISPNYVLTAGHCCDSVQQITVYLGLYDTNNGSGALYFTVPSTNIFNHPQYNPNNYQNDICILKLPSSAPINSQIGTILLPKSAWAPPTTFDNYNMTASGWGQTMDSEVGIHQILQYRTIHKMPQAQCVSNYTDINTVTNGMMCTDKIVTYAGPCHGDSGGPLTVKLKSGLYVVGAVSWSYGDCSSDYPVVYCNVAAYLNWITSVTGLPGS